jgi:hypothetical protein
LLPVVLDDPPVVQAADRDPPEVHLPAAVGAGHHAPIGDAIGLGDLADDVELRSSNSGR